VLLQEFQAAQAADEARDGVFGLELLLLEGDGGQQRQLLGCGRGHVGHQAVHSDVILLVLEAGQGPDQPPGRVGHDGGPGRVEVARRSAGTQFYVHNPFQAQGEDRPPGCVFIARLPQAAVGPFQKSPIFRRELGQVDAAYLLLPLVDELQPQG